MSFRPHTLCLLSAAILLLVVIAGCDVPGGATHVQPLPIPAEDELLTELDGVLDMIYRERRLNLRDHAAWQILHGALAFQRDYLVERPGDGKLVGAVDHILRGGQMKGWDTEPGAVLDEATNRRGLRALREPGTRAGQGHYDQWLAILSQCGVQPTEAITVHGHSTPMRDYEAGAGLGPFATSASVRVQYTMQEYVQQVQWDVPFNADREYSWTLIGLTAYAPTDARWVAGDGGEWTVERLVEMEAERELGDGACGGTHRLIGMSMALNRHVDQGRPVEGAWRQADQRVREAVKIAQHFQNEDGSFSVNYFARPGRSTDLKQNLGATGHTLEFLTFALTPDELQQAWVKRAVVELCDNFRQTRNIRLECGALYHAAHALVLYRELVFGPREYVMAPGRPAPVE